MEHYFTKGTRVEEIDLDKIDFFNNEQKHGSRMAMKELLKSGDITVTVDGRLSFIGGEKYSAVINRLGYCVILTDEDILKLQETSLSKRFFAKTSQISG